MDIEQIRIAKREMEAAIRTSTTEAIDAFYLKTSMTPQSVYIELVDVTDIGAQRGRYIVYRVKTDVPL